MPDGCLVSLTQHCADRCIDCARLLTKWHRAFVSYLDTEGLRHTVEVEAGSLYEAVALAVKTFRQHDCEPGGLSQLEVEIRSSVIHTVTLKKIHDWVRGSEKSEGSCDEGAVA